MPQRQLGTLTSAAEVLSALQELESANKHVHGEARECNKSNNLLLLLLCTASVVCGVDT